jgi:hypothetical protein
LAAREVCPTCGRESEVVSSVVRGNQTTKTYSCGHSAFNMTLSESLGIGESLRLREKDGRGRVVLDAKVADGVDKRFSRKTGKALQLVFKDGVLVHLDCKHCHNQWKAKDAPDWTGKFEVTKDASGIYHVICLGCGRAYVSG